MLPSGEITDVQIENGRFSKIGKCETTVIPESIEKIDCTNKALIPPFYNTHTHAGMTLLRGYADDMPLFEWLSEHIWPMEAKLNGEDIYLGTKLAIVEMLKSGTVFFNDMYWYVPHLVKAVEEFGIRAAIGCPVMDRNAEISLPMAAEFIAEYRNNPLIQITVAPHAVYTCSEKNLRACAELARKNDVFLHIHISETEQENADCIKATGLTPVQYLKKIGVLDCKVIAAHCIYANDEDVKTLAESGTVISHCPTSNRKLASGLFPMSIFRKYNCKVTLGTDGCSSNNNLDMREEAKIASLLAISQGGATAMPVKNMLQIATRAGAEAFGINAGEIAVGREADALIIDLRDERMVPLYNLASNWIYSAGHNCIESVLVKGKLIMKNRIVPHADEVIDEVRRRFNRANWC